MVREPDPPDAASCDLPDDEVLNDILLQRAESGERHCHHRPLEAPRWVGPGDAGHMRGGDAVMALPLETATYVLPWWIMKNHHVANLLLEKLPVMVVLCEACSTASAFDRLVEGQRLHFRVDGKYNGTHILLDDETGSHWTPFNGLAIAGPLRGTQLRKLLMHQCRWAELRVMFDNILVPDGEGESREGHGSGFPNPFVQRPVPFARQTIKDLDQRLPEQELVLGVEVGEHARTYRLQTIHDAGLVLPDVLGDTPVVVMAARNTWFATAFDARVDGRVLSFIKESGRASWRDRETGSRWDFSGKAISGPLLGKRLAYVSCGVEKWFAWAAAHPGVDIHVPPGQEEESGD